MKLEAEQSVIGALLQDNDAWDKIADKIEERDFNAPEHQLIFRHIARLIENQKRADVLTVADSLQNTGKLERIGGLKYLSDIENATPSVKNIASYADIVRKTRKERELAETVEDLKELVAGGGDVNEKIEQAVEILTALADDKKNTVLRLSEATTKAIETIEYRLSKGDAIHGLKTGFTDFDNKTGGLHSGDLIILAGRPSMGKSTFAVNIGENVAVDSGLPVLVFSLEMSDEQLSFKCMSSIGTINMANLQRAQLTDDDWTRLSHATGQIQDAPLWIDSNPMMNATQMHARARRIKRQHGLSLVIIDYLQLMSEGGDNRNNELSTITRKLKLMAKDLGVPVICLSQLSRKVEERTNKRPMMSDLRDSGAIEQDADLIVMMYRDDYYNPDSPNKGAAEAIISKQRMGETGAVILQFQGEYSRFKDFAGQYQFDAPAKKQQRGID